MAKAGEDFDRRGGYEVPDAGGLFRRDGAVLRSRHQHEAGFQAAEIAVSGAGAGARPDRDLNPSKSGGTSFSSPWT